MRKLLAAMFNWLSHEDAPAADEYEALLATLRAKRLAAMRAAR